MATQVNTHTAVTRASWIARVSLLTGAMSLGLLLANCGKNEEKKGDANMSAGCMVQRSTFNSGWGQPQAVSGPCNFNYQSFNGFSSYQGNGYTSGWGGGTMGCQAYEVPVYSQSKGPGCVSTQTINYSGRVSLYTLNGGVFTRAGGYYANQFGGNSWNSSTNNGLSSATFARACDLNGGDDKCPSGEECRVAVHGQVASGQQGFQQASPVGVCYF
jgi:hypothetical protein